MADRRRAGRVARRRGAGRSDTGPVRVRPLTTVKPVALRNLRLGTLVYAHVPFADGSGSKARPAVVLRADTHTVDVAPITSRDRRGDPDYAELSSWCAAGLSRRSFVAKRVITIARSAVYSVIGELGEEDLWVLTQCPPTGAG